MTLTEYPDLEQGSDEWHAARRGIVTASVVGQLITVRSLGALDYDCPACEAPANDPCRSKVKRGGTAGAPMKTVHTERTVAATTNRHSAPPVIEVADNDTSRGLTALLAAERITGFTDPTYVSDDMWRGVEDEPRAIDVYAKHYTPVVTGGFFVRREPTWTLGYSPDGLVGTDGLVEVKSRRSKKQLTTIVSGEVPPENLAQLQAGLLVTGRRWVDFISYSGGMKLWVKRVFPDPAWHAAIAAAVAAFEENATQMIAAYEAATVDMPMTERVVELEMMV